jgi:hypothetical protein
MIQVKSTTVRGLDKLFLKKSRTTYCRTVFYLIKSELWIQFFTTSV